LFSTDKLELYYVTLKTPRRLVLSALLLLSLIPSALAAPTGPIRYEVSIPNVADRKFRIAITVPMKPMPGELKESNVSLSIPAWSPGYYQILNFQKDISGFKAVDDKGKTLKVTNPDERTWTVMGGQGAIHATYDVTAKDAGFGFFGSHIDDKTGYINGASALMYVVNGKTLPVGITYRVPRDWKLASTLDPDEHGGLKSQSFKAEGYDELIDCPAQMGEFDRLDFTVKGTPFSAVLVGGEKVDKTVMSDVLSRVSEAGINLFGYAPFKRYTYFIHFAMGNFGGGLEHHNSTVLNVWKEAGQDPHNLTDLAAHEYFHAWNVKRLHPAVLGPFDYTQKVRTGALWFAEGVTDYYANVLPRMAGFTKDSDFRNEMANRIRQLQHNEARLRISVEEASQKSWEGGSMGFGGLSYYLKGSLMGLLFDVRIRAATDNAKSLDDVMRLLDERYGKKGAGYEEGALLSALNEVSGEDQSDFYNRYVRGTEEIPWNTILKTAGLTYEEGSNKVAFLGVATEPAKGLLVIRNVVKDSAAEKAGLKESDKIVTINGSRVDPATFQTNLQKFKPGQKIGMGIRRGETAMDFSVVLGERDDRYLRLRPLDDADEKAKRIRAGLLREPVASANR
jgi:predicted metalloprotease with PDZ domain